MAKFDWNSLPEDTGESDGKFDWKDHPTESSPSGTKLMAKMDAMAKEQGFKDYSDQSAKLGQGIMGGQIASLAGPAIGAISKFLGRGAGAVAPRAATLASGAAEEVAPAVEAATSPEAAQGLRVSNAGPIKNLPRPGSPLLEAAPEATAPELLQATRRVFDPFTKQFVEKAIPAATETAAEAAPAAIPTGSAAAEAAKQGLIELAKKHPLIGSILASGGVGLAGPEKIFEAIKHSPKLAAGAGVAALESTPLGALGENFLSNKLGQGASSASVDTKIAGLKGEKRWAMAGFQNVLAHDPSGDLTDEKTIERAFASPEVRQLFIQASDLKPGSKAMANIVERIQQKLKGAK